MSPAIIGPPTRGCQRDGGNTCDSETVAPVAARFVLRSNILVRRNRQKRNIDPSKIFVQAHRFFLATKMLCVREVVHKARRQQ
jgi:hypothetical protein